MDTVLMVIVLQIVGTLAILAELLLPSFGLLTLAAFVFFGYSYHIVWSHSPAAIIPLVALNLISIPATLIFVVKRLKTTKSATLENTIDSKAFMASVEIGETGVATTDLRPAGVALINGKHTDVYSEGGYIQKGAKIKVLSAENAGIKVAQTQE